MYLVREVFHSKPGKAKELVKKFKQMAPFMEKEGMKGIKVMTDAATTYWTVVVQSEVEDLGRFFRDLRGETSQQEVGEIMKGYMDLVEGGYREIFLIE